MKYNNTIRAAFIERLNRFEAAVDINGSTEIVHVKNTGRCRELLVKGAEIILSVADNPARKTKYDLITVYKPGIGWVNIDSQAPNKVVAEWLIKQGCQYIKPEYTYGQSRIDFYIEKDGHRILMEVKGCTLEKDHIGYFPDAPTQRGIKHLKELTEALGNTDDKRAIDNNLTVPLECAVAFVIQMEHVNEVRANEKMHKEFAEALDEAKKSGVKVLFLGCHVTGNELYIDRLSG